MILLCCLKTKESKEYLVKLNSEKKKNKSFLNVYVEHTKMGYETALQQTEVYQPIQTMEMLYTG